MNILVSFLGSVADRTGEKSANMMIVEPADLAALLAALINKYPDIQKVRKYLFISVNGRLATRDHPLADGDRVELFFRMGGG